MRPYIFRLPEFLGEIPDWIPLFGGTQLGGRPIFSYGVMLGISFLLGWMLSSYFIERSGYSRRRTNFLFVLAGVGAILGARILYFVASARGEFTMFAFFQFQKGGLVAYGGFLGGLLTSAVAAVVMKAEWWGRADAVAPALALGTGVTRIGCFLFGCDFGQQTGAGWGLHFPRWNNPATEAWIPSGSPAFSQHFHDTGTMSVISESVHPTQLLMSLNGFLGFVVLMLVFPYRKFRGQVLLLFLAYYGVTRFLVELLRGDKIRGTTTLGLPLSTSQFVSTLIILGVVPVWWWLSRRDARKVTST
jgi:phosphatidylglycerol---prolipoprotein diacylglyceryl transferase